ncbi:MAG: UDP-N-acetylmuramoyl-L-alanine--D-glutamate ligase [Puniceicoccales bacterium]|jgi:UDP-N-acetylmuramoylalanine--D-glutamate ligase|nr:UDP-N-acetylmuramoyl-L-alanine--D-glutamate ligase [Puniceicoccales bacterium]
MINTSKNQFLKSKPTRIGIIGSGVTGRAVAQFCHECDIHTCSFDDEHSPNCELSDCTYIVYSPGAINSPFLREARRAGIFCMNDLDFAQNFYENRTIAVTGTNGKTSTAEMLHHILKKFHIPSLLTGNIGIPPISRIRQFNGNPEMWNICEVSSFQAQDLTIFHPDYGLWTNFSHNHMDVHGTLEDYFWAKWNLMRRVREAAIVNASVFRWPFAGNLSLDRIFTVRDEKIPETVLSCAHQMCNFLLIRALLEKIIPNQPIDPHLLKDFHFPPHRLHVCGTAGNLTFWNDSKATNSAAVRAAIAHVKKFCDHLVWITCGRSKGEPMKNFRHVVDASDMVLVMGEVGGFFLTSFPLSKVRHCQDDGALIEQIYACVNAHAQKKCAILLSPGFSSFDRFQNYENRGHWFECISEQVIRRIGR